jgi:hypothetical protein
MKPPCKYSVGQRVEILVADFAVSGFPLAWTAGTVTDVCEMPGGLSHFILVRLDNDGRLRCVSTRDVEERIRALS